MKKSLFQLLESMQPSQVGPIKKKMIKTGIVWAERHKTWTKFGITIVIKIAII